MKRRTALFSWGLLVVLAVLATTCFAAEEWESLRAVYDYDASAPLDPRTDSVEQVGGLVYERFSYVGEESERVPALLIRPADVERPPCVLFLHGLGGSKEQARLVATLLAPQGMAVVAIDAVLHGERAQGELLEAAPTFLGPRGPMVRTVIDNRRAIDYISSRDDVDARRLVLVGASMGAILGSIVAAVDERVDAAALIVGGGDWPALLATSQHPLAQRLREAGDEEDERLAYVDPVNFVGHISPRPVLMVNGTADAIIPKVCAEALHEAAGEPREIIWYEGGHVGMPPQVLQTIVGWVVEHAVDVTPAPAG